MRRSLLTGTFVVLIAALLAMWACRFERVAGLPVWHLADLRDDWVPVPGVDWSESPAGPCLKLHVQAGGKPVSLRLALPNAPEVEGLHLRFRLESHGLVPGSEKWQDGRFMIEWHSPDQESAPEMAPVGSVRWDSSGKREDLVIAPLRGPAIPALRIEHLGREGDIELSELEIIPVREGSLWRIGRWILALAWVAWFAVLIDSWDGLVLWRRVFAAVVWVMLATQFVVPGPWRLQRPLLISFHFGGSAATLPRGPNHPVMDGPAAIGKRLKSGAVVELGKVPDQGSWVLRVKLAVTSARPLLHALLLFAPTLVLLFLIGKRPGLSLAAWLAVSIELAQTAFGYGFDFTDLGDLASDAVGISLAFWVWKKILKKPLYSGCFRKTLPSVGALLGCGWFMG